MNQPSERGPGTKCYTWLGGCLLIIPGSGRFGTPHRKVKFANLISVPTKEDILSTTETATMDPQAQAGGDDGEESIAGKRLDLATATFLEEEEVGIDTEADQFAFPAPPNDGRYLCKLVLNQEFGIQGAICGKDSKTPGKKYAKLPVTSEILEGPFEGMKFTDFPTTLTTQRGTNAIAGLLLALNQPVNSRTTAKELLETAEAVLATEPSAYVTGRWEAYVKETKKRIKGQKNFPPVIGRDGEMVKGKHQHQYIDKDGNEVKAQFNVERYDSAE